MTLQHIGHLDGYTRSIHGDHFQAHRQGRLSLVLMRCNGVGNESLQSGFLLEPIQVLLDFGGIFFFTGEQNHHGELTA